MSDKGRGTKVEAWSAQNMFELMIAMDDVCEGVLDPRHRNTRLVRLGFDRGFVAAEAALRERIIARCTIEMKDESLMDAYDEGYNDGLAKAIEIVKGESDD